MNRIESLVSILLLITIITTGCAQVGATETTVESENSSTEETLLETEELSNNTDDLSQIITGIIKEINDEELLVTQDSGADVIITFDEFTFKEGISQDLEVGNAVSIMTTGIATRSLPAQMIGTLIQTNTPSLNTEIHGVVKEIKDQQLLVTQDSGTDVIITFDELIFKEGINQDLQVGNTVSIMTTGIATRSLPAQMIGTSITSNTPSLNTDISGQIVAIEDSSISLKTEDNIVIVINFEEFKYVEGISTDISLGNTITVETTGIATASIPAQMSGIIIKENNEGELLTIEQKILDLNNNIHLILNEGLKEGTIKTNEIIAINLSENPSTGYYYSLEYNENVLEQVIDEQIQPDVMLLGSPMNHILGFKSEVPGDYTIQANLYSPSDVLEKTIEFNISIQ